MNAVSRWVLPLFLFSTVGPAARVSPGAPHTQAIPKGNTMELSQKSLHFTAETSSNGVLVRDFTVGEVSGALWSPPPPRPNALPWS